MTLFEKLAGKASALLNASGICSNNCIDGHCSGCGECCADLLPLTKGEIKRLRDYARKHQLQENENDLIRRGDALKAIRKACISAYLPFDSATPEGQRVMDALYAVWKVKKEGKTHDSI